MKISNFIWLGLLFVWLGLCIKMSRCQIVLNSNNYKIFKSQQVSMAYANSQIDAYFESKVSRCVGKCNQLGSTCNLVSYESPSSNCGTPNCVLYNINSLYSDLIFNFLQPTNNGQNVYAKISENQCNLLLLEDFFDFFFSDFRL